MIFRLLPFLCACVLGQGLFFAQDARADSGPRVYATIPELTWILRELSPQGARVESLVEAGVNAHYVDAKPSFVMKLRDADMVCAVGLGLEGAWLGRSIERSFNHKLNSTHSCTVGPEISVIGEANSPKDRSHGHLHAEGNPHFWYAPSRMIEAANYLSNRVQFLYTGEEGEASRGAELTEKSTQLTAKLHTLLSSARAKLSKNSVRTVSQYHSDFDYLIEDLGLEKTMSIESKPGVPPSTAQLSKFKKTMSDKKVKVILSLPWDPKESVFGLAKELGATVVEWPVNKENYLEAFEIFVQRLDEALQ